MAATLGVPEDPASVTFTEGEEAAQLQIKHLCKRLLDGWGGLADDDLQITKISGGISNLLVKVAPPPASGVKPVAVKVFGDKTELLIDREAEKQTLLRLNAVGFGAQVVGLFGNGRVEAFLTAKTLTPEEMASPQYLPHIARRLRRFHGLDMRPVAAAAADADEAAGKADGALVGGLPKPEPTLWQTIFGWLDMAAALSFDDPAKQAAYERVDFVAMRAELEALVALCGRVHSPIVFAHNDMLSGNILIIQPEAAEEVAEAPAATAPSPPVAAADGEAAATDGSTDEQPQKKARIEESSGASPGHVSSSTATDATPASGAEMNMQFIDFEYSAYGFRGFDLGNHFNEYAGFDCDYTRYPEAEGQMDFFRHYLGADDLRRQAEELRLEREKGSDAAALLAAAEAEVLWRMVAETNIYALASHSYWGVWSFIQARYSPIDFDYLEYSAMRWREYHRRKAEFVALVEKHFGASSANGSSSSSSS